MHNQVHTWRLSTISPLHIGDGTELNLNLDFVQGKDRHLEMLDLEELLQQLAEIPRAVQDLGNSFELDRILRDYKVQKSLLYSLPYRTDQAPRNLRSMIKDAFHRPYLPGSSLKGSLRTALWKHCLARGQLPDPGREFKKFSSKVNKIGSNTPHEDFLRPLAVSDSAPVQAEGRLAVEEVKYFNLQSGNKAGWKDFFSKQTRADHKQARGVAVEALQPEQTMVLQTSLIPFLQDERVQQAGKIPKCAGLQDLESFCRTINRQSLQIVNEEISFFSEYKPATSSVLEFYQGLMKQILALDKEPHKCILRLAWGSGWLGMTGDWMDQSTMQAVRQEKNLGRKGFPFPKTRRLAMKDGQPRLPLGWVLLEPDESVRQEFQAAARLSRPTPETGKETQGAAPAAEAKQGEKPPAAKSPEELRQETVQELRAALKQAGSGLSGQIDFMLERIQAQEDSQTREEMCSELIKAAKKLKSFKKARQAGKPWVVKIEELARSCGLEL